MTLPISSILLSWWDDDHADHPWRQTKNPYHIWLSEIMLQQTQIATVIDYYQRWLQKFPTIESVAQADLNEILKQWEGLGYYSRARNFHKTAQLLVSEYQSTLPQTHKQLLALPGIGPYTAGAIASIAFDLPEPVVDGNVIRLLTRLYDLNLDITKAKTKKLLWQKATALVPQKRAGEYNQALMELGQTICTPTKPDCHLCPLTNHCLARQKGTQLERPVRPPRKKIPHYDVAAGIIWNNQGEFLITQRPLDKLLGGLWEFPGGKQEANETLPATLIREIAEELTINVTVTTPLLPIKHRYTHFQIILYPFHAHYESGTIQHIGVINHAWVTLADLDKYPFAVTDQKIIAQLKKQLNNS